MTIPKQQKQANKKVLSFMSLRYAKIVGGGCMPRVRMQQLDRETVIGG
jgi:hypothetical protein